jgi:predicted transposase YbfD/YdcC
MNRTCNLLSYFSEMKDPRIDRTKRHLFDDIIFIAIASVLSGGQTWNDMQEYGEIKQEWLSTFLELPNGIPSHDTFNRFFAAISPEEFEKCFLNWVKEICERTHGEVVSIDGKTIRGSRSEGNKSATHIVSAWADQNELILGQIKVDDKSNEITAIPKLLEALVLDGCVITIDAMGCQKNIAKKIISKNANYILSVKENQKELHDDIQDSFRILKASDYHDNLDYGHGRIETRKCSIISDLSLVENAEKWMNIKAIVKMERERYFKATGKTENETSYYISSINSAEQIYLGIRKHWGIENKVHWILDVAFGEDLSRKRTGNAAQNYSTLNRIALNLLKKDDSKVGIKSRMKKAGWGNEYLIKLIRN